MIDPNELAPSPAPPAPAFPFEILQTKMIPASKINPAPYNPRTISKEDKAALKELIVKEGFSQPLILQARTFVLISGHQRFDAVKELCFAAGKPIPSLPCYVLNVTDRRAKQLNLAFNKVGGVFDTKLLASVMASLDREEKMSHEEIKGMGFEDGEVNRLLKMHEPKAPKLDDDEPKAFGSSVTLSLSFDSVKLRDTVKSALGARATREKVKNGAIVADLLGVS